MNGVLLAQFRARISEIDGYRRYLAVAAQYSDSHPPQHSDGTPTVAGEMAQSVTRGLRKRLDYSSIVVALYGAIEEFVERLVEGCVTSMNESTQRYHDLPAQFRGHHEKLSVKLLDKIHQPGYRGHMNVETVVDNLHGCLSGRESFKLNQEAFSLHSANVRHKIVREMFALASIPFIDQLIAGHPLTQSLLTELGRSEGEPHFYLDDLAERRNVVAHGELPQDIVSLATLYEYVRAALTFGEALYESAILGVCDVAMPSIAVPIGKPTRTLRSGRIVCFQPGNAVRIRVGDRLVWRTQTRWRTAMVDTLEVDRSPYEEIQCSSGARFGAGISANGSEASDYWVLPESDGAAAQSAQVQEPQALINVA